jgi:hypothetical protein
MAQPILYGLPAPNAFGDFAHADHARVAAVGMALLAFVNASAGACISPSKQLCEDGARGRTEK